MKGRKNVFKIIVYLLMIVTLTIITLVASKFLEKEINAIPTLSKIIIASNNASNTEFAKLDDIISLTIIANEDIQEPTVTIAGEVANVTESGNTYTATYGVTSTTSEINIIYIDESGEAVATWKASTARTLKQIIYKQL